MITNGDLVRSEQPAPDPIPDPTPQRRQAFAPPPPHPPSRLARGWAKVLSVLRHEWLLASLGSVVLAVVMTWPAIGEPTRRIPRDLWDPTLVATQIAWSGHALTHHPSQLWHANTFYPESFSYAFTETLLGYAPAALIGTGPVAAVLRYNILYILVFALAFVGAYALVRQLGAGRVGAALAGAAFAYAPWRLGQSGHLHVLSSGGIVLALAMLARGHGWSLSQGYRPYRVRPGWAFAGWLVAAWQITIAWGIGLPFAYVLLLIIVVAAVGWLRYPLRTARPRISRLRTGPLRTARLRTGPLRTARLRVSRLRISPLRISPLRTGRRRDRAGLARTRRPLLPVRLLTVDVVGGLVFAAVGALMAYPYMQVVRLHPESRRVASDLGAFSPPLRGFFTAPPESLVWGGAHVSARNALKWAPEMAMLPGFALYVLAAAGLIVSIWSLRQRILLATGVAVTVALSMGTRGIAGGNVGYLLLYRTLPGFDALRTPGRLVLWTTLLLGVLAAGTVSAFARRARDLAGDRNLAGDRGSARPRALLRLAIVAPLLLVLVEGLNRTPHPVVPQAPAALRTFEAPILVLPTDNLTDLNIMLWGTDGFPRMVNGASSFTPERLRQIRAAAGKFPEVSSVDTLRTTGVKTVVVLRDQAAASPYAATIDPVVKGVGVTRQDRGAVVVYTID